VVGGPDTVRHELIDQGRTAGFNYLVLQIAFGSLTHDQERRSLKLFNTEVMPALAKLNSQFMSRAGVPSGQTKPYNAAVLVQKTLFNTAASSPWT